MSLSWQLAILRSLGRRVMRPKLMRTSTPEQAAADFARAARVFRAPPYLCRLTDGPLHWITAGPVAPRRLIVHFHGGAYFSGSGATHARMLGRLSRLTGVRVCAPDYPLLQEAPFPAAFESACAAWDSLMSRGYRPADIILGGDSAGAGLMLALLAQLTQRAEAPAAAYAMSPWTDLTMSGESLATFATSDPIIPVARMGEVAALYLAGAAPDDPRASPLFARFAAPPPVLIQVGAEEALRDDATRIADVLRTAGGSVELRLWPGAPHVWHLLDGWVPEARAGLREVAGFIQTSFDSASRKLTASAICG